MPELPEVEFAAGRLRDAAVGRTILTAEALHAAIGRSLTPEACARMEGRRIAAVARRAKIQLITLDDGQVLEVHVRMTGDWSVGRTGEAPPAFERARLTCTDGTRISLTDSRAFAVLRLHAPGALILPPLGPEPLSEAFTMPEFLTALGRRRGPIKPALLDQKLVAGVGNIYAAESLWVAQIHPTRAAASLSRIRAARLRDAIREVLRTAPVGRYFATEDSASAGEEAWRVYGREGQPCLRCGRGITRITQAGRSTFYCGGCQR